MRYTDAQLHSCKPSSGRAGGGTDEEFVPKDGAVRGRAMAEGRCLQAQAASAGSGFDVPVCNPSETLQKFAWDAQDGTLTLESSAAVGAEPMCVTAGAAMRQANSFWARDMELRPCAGTPTKLKKWYVVAAVNDNGSPAPISAPAPTGGAGPGDASSPRPGANAGPTSGDGRSDSASPPSTAPAATPDPSSGAGSYDASPPPVRRCRLASG